MKSWTRACLRAPDSKVSPVYAMTSHNYIPPCHENLQWCSCDASSANLHTHTHTLLTPLMQWAVHPSSYTPWNWQCQFATHSSQCTVICHLKVTSNLQLYTAKYNLQSQFVTSRTQCGLHYQQNTAANLQLYTRQHNLHHVNLALRAHNDILPCQFAAHNTKCNLQLCVTQQTEICNASLHVPPTPHSAVIYTATDASPCNLSAYVHTTNTTQVAVVGRCLIQLWGLWTNTVWSQSWVMCFAEPVIVPTQQVNG